MAKGDADRYQKMLDEQKKKMEGGVDPLRDQMGQTHQAFMNNYNRGSEMGFQSYEDMMNMYKGIYNDPNTPRYTPASGGMISPQMIGATKYDAEGNLVSPGLERLSLNQEFVDPVRNALRGYQQFADTGGYSEQDIADLRARGIAPTRAVFSSAMNNLLRAKNLAGGYSPNFNAAAARLTRDLANTISDQNVNVNASLADAIRQGKLAGLGGLSETGLKQQGMFLHADQANQDAFLRAALANQGTDLSAQTSNADNALRAAQINANTDLTRVDPRLAALAGMGSLYGTTPGMANLFGQQVLGNQGQQLGLEGLQGQNSMNLINAQMQRSQIPSNFQQAMGNIGTAMRIAGQVAAAVGTGGASLAMPGGGLYGAGSIMSSFGKGGGGGKPAAGGGAFSNYGQYNPMSGGQSFNVPYNLFSGAQQGFGGGMGGQVAGPNWGNFNPYLNLGGRP